MNRNTFFGLFVVAVVALIVGAWVQAKTDIFISETNTSSMIINPATKPMVPIMDDTMIMDDMMMEEMMMEDPAVIEADVILEAEVMIEDPTMDDTMTTEEMMMEEIPATQ